MKKVILIFLVFVAVNISAQMHNSSIDTRNYIEVTGSSETEIVPDEIYITIILKERFEGKDKITIEKQEALLKQALTDLGIPLADLSLSDANADYRKVKMSKKDLIATKSYLLKVLNVASLDKIYKKLDEQNAEDAFVSKLNHTKLQEFAKENRMKAIKAAKDKVDYLLSAVGQQAGKPLVIDEVENTIYNKPGGGNTNPYYYRNNRMSNAIQTVTSYGDDGFVGDGNNDISFTKIKIKASYFVKYEILSK